MQRFPNERRMLLSDVYAGSRIVIRRPYSFRNSQGAVNMPTKGDLPVRGAFAIPMTNRLATTPDVSRRMSRLRRRDTRPEVELRSELHRRGLRFRVDRRADASVRTRADVLFTRARVAVFVDGCFWHVCPTHQTWPRNNGVWWREKLLGNVTRDRRTDALLEAAGWTVVRVWEHEEAEDAADRVEATVRKCLQGRAVGLGSDVGKKPEVPPTSGA